MLNQSRAVEELSSAEARLLCDEGVAFVDGTFPDVDTWMRSYCRRDGLGAGTDQATCEAAEARCLERFETEPFFYLYNYSAECGSLERNPPVGCTVTVNDIERCYEELSATLLALTTVSCADVATVAELGSELSPGCRALFAVDAPCLGVLGR